MYHEAVADNQTQRDRCPARQKCAIQRHWSHSVCSDAVEPCAGRKPTQRTEVREMAVVLDLEDPDGAAAGIERIEIRTVGAHCDVQVRGTRRIEADHRSGERSERS